jgi:hypothetical protein
MFKTIALRELCKLFISSIIDDIFSVFRFSKLRHNVSQLQAGWGKGILKFQLMTDFKNKNQALN